MCDVLSVEIKKYQDDIEILEVLKPKFIRFNIDIEKELQVNNNCIHNIYDSKTNTLNEKLIIENNLEFENINKQFNSDYINLQLEYAELLYKFEAL